MYNKVLFFDTVMEHTELGKVRPLGNLIANISRFSGQYIRFKI